MPNHTADLGKWHVFETAGATAQHAAEWLCSLARARDGDLAICLSGGSTPRHLYQLLASDPVAARFPWNRAVWFWGDERFVPHDHPDSNYRMAYETLFSRVAVSRDRIHPIPTEGLSPEQAAAKYQTLLQRYYGEEQLAMDRPLFDITLLGIGENGHTASLFPGSAALQEQRRWALAVVCEQPEPRITLTYPALNSSHNLAFLVTGPNKQKILAQIRAGSMAPPAARIHPIGRLEWFVDRAAVPQ